MAAAKHEAEESANKHRGAAERFEVGDKVWLSLTNLRTPRPSRKLDWLHHKYTVTKVVSSNAVELDVPREVHRVFNVDLLRRAATDPLPGQVVDDAQPPPIAEADGDPEWAVEAIIGARWHKHGRGRYRQALVK